MKIVVTAPTGNVGAKVVERLSKQKGHELVLLARNPEKLETAKKQGAAIRQGDLADADFVLEATKDADALFFVIPSNPQAENMREEQGRVAKNGAHAMKENGIRQVVLLSSEGADLESGTGPILGLRDAEEIFHSLRPDATALVILRPTAFMENYFMQLDAIRQAGSVFMPVSPETKIALIATSDIADEAARLLTSKLEPGVEIHRLHGPREYRFDEAAEILGKGIGKPVKHVQVSPEQARESLESMGVSEDVAQRYIAMYGWFDRGVEFPRTERTTTPTTLEQFAEKVLAPAL
ncbi:MAG: NAD(P)H-binding protein [Candidatus Eisenbacteria bacterium]|nr:NAD(P)H-binding protein [Candidatus Latescibacterota bacterium]MBD3300929.1 NAD(P)H-binding protein [Candidatus Eisenbacteria bacterium]